MGVQNFKLVPGIKSWWHNSTVMDSRPDEVKCVLSIENNSGSLGYIFCGSKTGTLYHCSVMYFHDWIC